MEASRTRKTGTRRKSSPNGNKETKSSAKRSKAKAKAKPALESFNPATGEAIKIKASKKVAFRASKDLKEAV